MGGDVAGDVGVDGGGVATMPAEAADADPEVAGAAAVGDRQGHPAGDVETARTARAALALEGDAEGIVALGGHVADHRAGDRAALAARAAEAADAEQDVAGEALAR